MKVLGISMLAAVALMCAATPSLAQAPANAPAGAPEQPAAPHSAGSGTAPAGMGSTGWTGGSRGQTTTTGQGSGKVDPEAAANQPVMATGQDLNGPGTRFPANQTPE